MRLKSRAWSQLSWSLPRRVSMVSPFFFTKTASKHFLIPENNKKWNPKMRSTSVICSSAKPPQMRKWKLSFGEPDFWYLILMPWVKWERNEKGNDNQWHTHWLHKNASYFCSWNRCIYWILFTAASDSDCCWGGLLITVQHSFKHPPKHFGQASLH